MGPIISEKFRHQEFIGNSGEFVSAVCRLYKYYDKGQPESLDFVDCDYDLRLSDGKHVLNYNLESYNKEVRAESLAFVEKLIGILTQLKDSMAAVNVELDELEATIDQAPKSFDEVFGEAKTTE